MTHATETVQIRRMLGDTPIEDALGGSLTDSATNPTVTDITLYQAGQTWESSEVSSTGAEQILIKTVPSSGATFSSGGIKRAHNGSTATSHASGSLLYLDPRYKADLIVQYINKVLAVDLYESDVFEIVEHQITSSASTNTYNAPSSNCEEFLQVSQVINSGEEPRYLSSFTRRLLNADTTLYSNGKSATIRQNFGVPGTALYYVDCKHRLSISTITARQSEALRAKVCHYLLATKDISRVAGPTNQSDRTVRVSDATRLASYWQGEFERIVKAEAYELRQLVQPERRWIKKRRYRGV